ncbi:MAG TPA: non-canonical purine NTP pyrophosphatase [Candidatus Dormibacteraeota bacterium]|nr:non-canonical purine NTP pyrophosphatase [Candidatus Dormibacteraeota bacterium]
MTAARDLPPRLAVASANPGKVNEYRRLLAGLAVELEAIAPDVVEDGVSYAANAVLKAEAVANATGLPALGDDSGLEIEPLGGFPGLHSARLAPTQAERNRIVLERLAGLPRPWRARFVCALAVAAPGRPTRVFIGRCEGEIVEPRPGGGFGYDPMFLVPEVGRTFSEMPPAEKDRWSHRGAAVRALRSSDVPAELGLRAIG